MYELVNTSLPNGLIAGTHGFATVAMTRGISDILRGRLENLCAYTHRTSDHGATYYQQNPVNWFHVILPQGEHVVGRVAPSDFDYTGRTNRLAKLRVFGASEMPRVGGAEILAKEKNWFSQPWQGDPRYLETDKSVCERLRNLNPVQGSSAPAWEALFGGNGAQYARQVAWQIEKNLAAGGKTVYFKTSTAWDVSGEKLLGLFADVINLLPVELRAKVTFSTYPVSLPGGTGCTLRGIYDRDKFFDMASATQAWIDCENAKIVHAEQLPTSGGVRKIEKSEGKSEPKVESKRPAIEALPTARPVAESATPRPSLGIRRDPPPAGAKPHSYQNLITPQKKGPDMLIIGLVLAALVVLVGAGGCFFWMMQSSKRQMEESGVAAAREAENQRLADEKAEREKEEVRKRKEAEEQKRRQQEQAEAEKEKEKGKEQKEEVKSPAGEVNTNKVEKTSEPKEVLTEAEKYQRKLLAALRSKIVQEAGTPSKPKTGFVRSKEVVKMSVYYYIDNGMMLTNEVAGFKSKSNPLNRQEITDYLLYVRDQECNESSPDKMRQVLGDSPVVLWVANDNLWFDWSHRERNRRIQWFKDAVDHDLQVECFGLSDHVFELYNKAFPVTYSVSWNVEDNQKSAEWSSREFTITNAMKIIFKSRIEFLEGEVEKAEKSLGKLRDEVEKAEKEKAKVDTWLSDYDKKSKALKECETQLNGLPKDRQEKMKEKKWDAKAKEEYKSKEKSLKKQKKDLEGEMREMTKQQSENQAKDKQASLKKQKEDLDKQVKDQEAKLEAAKKELEAVRTNPKREQFVRELSFGATVKGANE